MNEKKKIKQIWNAMRVRKCWQNINFGVSCPFKWRRRGLGKKLWQGWLCAFPIPHAYFTLFCSLFRGKKSGTV